MSLAGLFSLVGSMFMLPVFASAENYSRTHHPLPASDADSNTPGGEIGLLHYDSRIEAQGLLNRLGMKHFIADIVEKNIGGETHLKIINFAMLASASDQVVVETDIEFIAAPAVEKTSGADLAAPKIEKNTVADAFTTTKTAELTKHTMTLQQVVKFGLEHNVQYRQQLAQLPINDLDVQAAHDPFTLKTMLASSSNQRVGAEIGQDYQINFNKKFAPGTNVGLGFGTARFSGQSLSQATLSLRQPLLRGRGSLVNTMGIEDAEQHRLRQKNLIVHQKQQLILDIISAYYRSVLQQKSIQIHQTTIEQSQNMLDTSKAKFNFGMVSRMDVFRAELQLLEAQESYESAKSGHEKSLDELKLLIGAKLDDVFLLSDSIRFQAVHLAPEHKLIEQALASRPELANLKINQKLQAKRIIVAQNNMLPQLDLTLQVSQSNTANSFAKSTRLKDTRVGFGISGSPDFSMAAEEAQYRRQLLAFEHAHHQYQQAVEKIRSAVKQRVRQLKQGEKRISLRQRKVVAAEKQKQYALVRYQKGLVDNAVLVDAEKGMVTAKIGYLQAVVDYNISLYALYKETSQLNTGLLNHMRQQQK